MVKMRLLSTGTQKRNCHFEEVKQRMMEQSLPCGTDLKTGTQKRFWANIEM